MSHQHQHQRGSVAESRDKLSPAPPLLPQPQLRSSVSPPTAGPPLPTTTLNRARTFISSQRCYDVRYGVRWFTFNRSDVLQHKRRSQARCTRPELCSPFAEPLVHEEEDSGQDQAHEADADVRNAEERILTSQPRSVRNDQLLRSFE